MTNKIKVTFEVDSGKLFNTLRAMSGDCASFGERIAQIMLTPHNAPFLTMIGLGIYGVEYNGEPTEKAAPNIDLDEQALLIVKELQDHMAMVPADPARRMQHTAYAQVIVRDRLRELVGHE